MIKIEDIISIVYEAGNIALDIYGREFSVEEKSNKSPVTEADLAVDKFLHEKLEQYGHPILSEEQTDDSDRLESEFVWIIDPLDGTSDFIQKTDEFTIMVGLVQGNEPILGVVYSPASNELYYAEKGKGAYIMKDGLIEELRTTAIDSASPLRIFVSRNHLGEKEQQVAEKFGMEKISMGSAGYKMAKIAEGKGEYYINSSDKSFEWDTCAGAIIVREAGGMITDMKGTDMLYNQKETCHKNGYVVSNKKRHEEVVEFLGE